MRAKQCTYAATTGFVAAFPIFNQIDIGMNLSLIWVAVLIAPLVYGIRPVAWPMVPLLALLGVFLLKFAVVANIEATVRYAIYIGFVMAAVSGLDRRRMDEVFRGLEIGLFCNVAFGCIQMAGLLTGTFDAIFPVTAWNASLWHYNPPGGMFLFYPRVSGFCNEPAYLGTLLIAQAAYRLFVQGRRTLTGRYGVYLFVSIVLLVNSRTAFASYVWLVGCVIVTRFRWRLLSRHAARAVFVASFVILPLFIMLKAGTDFDYEDMLTEDVSVFARTVPILWIREANNLSVVNFLLGVANYRTYSLDVNMPAHPYVGLALQGALLDAKSLGGAYFYDLGLLGLAGFIAAVFVACRAQTRALLMFSTVNIAFFNVYAFSWPLFWIMTACCCLPVEIARPARHLPRLVRQRAGGAL